MKKTWWHQVTGEMAGGPGLVSPRVDDVKKATEIIKSLSDEDKKELGPRWFYKDAQYRYVMSENEKPIGFIEARILGSKGYLNLAVSPDHQGKGVATELVKTAVKEIPAMFEVETLYWVSKEDNKTSVHLAEKFGFSPKSTKDGEIRLTKDVNGRKSTGEIVSVVAKIVGEIKPEDIPTAPGVELDILKAGDEDPVEVVVEVPTGRSKRGWNYKPESIQAIVKHVQEKTLSGFLGHQKPEDVDSEFKPPVTHWVGAVWKDGKAYFRGVVDSAAKDLKRWIKSNRINQVSIYGIPKLVKVAGETNVVDYIPLSIDWTPLDRAGMPTRIVAIGEMDQIIGGEQTVNYLELLAALRKMLNNKEITLGQVAGEMGWTASSLAGELDAKWLQDTKDNTEMLAKVREALGITGEMDLVARAKEAFEALEEKKKSGHTELIDQVVKEKVTGEIAQSLVKKMLVIPEDATKEQITGEIDKVLNDPALKDALSKLHIDRPAYTGAGQKASDTDGMLVSRKVSI